MSFVEKHKAWLLPILGLGVLGVGYMNFRTLGETPPPAQGAAEPAPPGPEAPVPAPAPEAGGEDLWSDLRPFAVLPADLAEEGALRDRARVALDPELEPLPSLDLGRPAGTSLAPPPRTAVPAFAEPAAVPPLDFVIHGPEGARAWFGGRAYRSGESIPGSGYTLGRIGVGSVELTGPRGRLVTSTHPTQPLAHLPAEAP